MKKTERNSGGVGIMSVVQVVFLILKLTGVISWSWVWVLSPLWISVLLVLLIVIIVAVVVKVTN